MNNKEKFYQFCEHNYVPLFSQPWWMDAICGENNWDVWVYEKGNDILATMPYYYEYRGQYKYITKAKLTQNNGIIFHHASTAKLCSKASLEQKIIEKANEFIESLGLDVYEQQYHYSFNNWQPFFWKNYTCIVRYTYVIEDTRDMDAVDDGFTAKLRSIIKKGKRNTIVDCDIDSELFYSEHEKVFLRQGLKCPFDLELWQRLYNACSERNCCKTMFARDFNGTVNSVAFFVWDDEAVYLLLGGSMPGFSQNDTYSYLIYKGIELASNMNLKFDFEGSMIERVAHASRQFGGIPKPYYRIRKVFNPEIVRKEAEEYITKVKQGK